MKTMRIFPAFFAVVVMLTLGGLAQEKPKPQGESKPITPLKVLVVFNEFEGEKKISSLPYAFLANADDRTARSSSTLRMGIRVPVVIQGKDLQFQYIDVGTNMDCIARVTEEGRFKLDLVVERSSLYTAGPERKSLDWSPGDPPLSTQPIIRQFKMSLNLLVRDGQTIQGAMATDPVSGRVLKVDVTLNVVK